MPWALEIARHCRKYQQFPQSGGWFDQDELLLVLLGIAENAEFVYSKKGEWTNEDKDFIRWVEEDA